MIRDGSVTWQIFNHLIEIVSFDLGYKTMFMVSAVLYMTIHCILLYHMISYVTS